METTPALVFSPGRRHVPLSQGDMVLLESIGRFGLVTAEQLTRLHTPTPHGLRSMQRRLKRLVDAGLLLRLRAHPTPRYGSAPHVFSLANPGRVCLAACLARSVPEVSLTRLRTERELKHEPLRVAPDPTRPARTVAVIPDAWFQLVVAGTGTYSIALELDRGSEHRARWATKAAALSAWAVGPYKRGFDTDNLTIAIVAPTAARRDSLADWIDAELEDRNLSELRGVFLITCADPASIPAEDLFFLPHWYQPGTSEPVRLMQPLAGPPQRVWDVAADYR